VRSISRKVILTSSLRCDPSRHAMQRGFLCAPSHSGKRRQNIHSKPIKRAIPFQKTIPGEAGADPSIETSAMVSYLPGEPQGGLAKPECAALPPVETPCLAPGHVSPDEGIEPHTPASRATTSAQDSDHHQTVDSLAMESSALQ
jgi:hypothetical protein